MIKVTENDREAGDRIIVSEFLLFDKETIAIQKGKYRLIYGIEDGESVLVEAGTDKPIDYAESPEAENAADFLKQTLIRYLKLAEEWGGKPKLIRPDKDELERLREIGYLQ